MWIFFRSYKLKKWIKLLAKRYEHISISTQILVGPKIDLNSQKMYDLQNEKGL